MRTVTGVGAFALGLVAVFGASTALGNVVGPIGPAADEGAHSSVHSGMDAGPVADAPLPEGLSSTLEGYTLRLAADTAPAGPSTLSFTVAGPDGKAVTDYTPTHDRELHLIVVRRDLTGFQHVHPKRDAAGTWSVPLALPTPGAYKVFADFAPGSRTTALVLGTDLTVPGAAAAEPLPPISRTASVDGYDVTLEGDLVAGTESALTLTVRKGGQVVTPQPYLAALGHLVALRPGDLAYLHVHPEKDRLRFMVDVPTAGTYRLFLDFRHGDVVRTAPFTVEAR